MKCSVDWRVHNDRVKDAAVAYVETLNQMAAATDEAGILSDRPGHWNRLVDRLEDARKGLAKSEDGRAVISALLNDPRATVRLWAAGHALQWRDPEARAVLEAMSRDQRLGLNRLNAEMTLREFDAGRLKPDW